MKLNEIKRFAKTEEVRQIGKNVISVSDCINCYEAYNNAYTLAEREFKTADTMFISQVALTDIYVMGYIEGVRAERRKKNTSIGVEVNG